MRSWLIRLVLIAVFLTVSVTALPAAASTSAVLPVLTAPTWIVHTLSTWLPFPTVSLVTSGSGSPDPQQPDPDVNVSIDPDG